MLGELAPLEVPQDPVDAHRLEYEAELSVGQMEARRLARLAAGDGLLAEMAADDLRHHPYRPGLRPVQGCRTEAEAIFAVLHDRYLQASYAHQNAVRSRVMGRGPAQLPEVPAAPTLPQVRAAIAAGDLRWQDVIESKEKTMTTDSTEVAEASVAEQLEATGRKAAVEITEAISTAVPAVEDVEQAVTDAVAMAETMTVDSPEEAAKATEFLVASKRHRKTSDEQRLKVTKPLRDITSQLNDYFKLPLKPLEAADKVVRGALSDWQAEQERLAREQAEREAREQAERERVAAEKAAAEKAAAEAAERTKADAENEQAKAEAAEAAEKLAAAQAAEQAAADDAPLFPAPAAQSGPVRTSGGTAGTRKRTVVKITNPDLVPRQFCEPSMSALRQAAKSGIRQIPGVEITETNDVVIR